MKVATTISAPVAECSRVKNITKLILTNETLTCPELGVSG